MNRGWLIPFTVGMLIGGIIGPVAADTAIDIENSLSARTPNDNNTPELQNITRSTPVYKFTTPDEPVCSIHTGRGYWQGKNLPDKYFLHGNGTTIEIEKKSDCLNLSDSTTTWVE